MSPDCGAGGFFADWWLPGSWYQLVSTTCKFESGWRRIVGYGGEIIVFVVSNVLPDGATSSTVGCSFAATHDYVLVEATASAQVAAHEIGHACLLPHSSDSNNLMSASNIPATPTLTNVQIATIRWSRHCTYL